MPSDFPFAAPSLPQKGDSGSQPFYYGIPWDKMGVNGILWEIPTELSTELNSNAIKRKANQCLAQTGVQQKLKLE